MRLRNEDAELYQHQLRAPWADVTEEDSRDFRLLMVCVHNCAPLFATGWSNEECEWCTPDRHDVFFFSPHVMWWTACRRKLWTSLMNQLEQFAKHRVLHACMPFSMVEMDNRTQTATKTYSFVWFATVGKKKRVVVQETCNTCIHGSLRIGGGMEIRAKKRRRVLSVLSRTLIKKSLGRLTFFAGHNTPPRQRMLAICHTGVFVVVSLAQTIFQFGCLSSAWCAGFPFVILFRRKKRRKLFHCVRRVGLLCVRVILWGCKFRKLTIRIALQTVCKRLRKHR